MAVNKVRLFGLTIDSEVPLPGLLAAPDDASADVVVRFGAVRDADLEVAGIGRFAVTGGREIVVDVALDVPERNLRIYLLGGVMGLLLHQRGLFPLHANAVAVDGRAIAVAGSSGAGKSTLAAWFAHRGLPLIGDDVIALKQEEGGHLVALSGPPRVRLWRQSLDRFGLDSDGLEQSYLDPDYDKWDVPVEVLDLSSAGMLLGAVYVLEDGPELAIRPLAGVAAVTALFDHTYRGEYVDRASAAAGHWQAATAIARKVPVFRLERPRDLSRLDALGALVLSHARRQAARTDA